MKSWQEAEIDNPKRKARSNYSVLAWGSASVGMLAVAFALAVWLGAYRNISTDLHSVASSAKSWAGLVLVATDIALVLGIGSLKGTHKAVSIAGIVLCAVATFPLVAMLLDQALLNK